MKQISNATFLLDVYRNRRWDKQRAFAEAYTSVHQILLDGSLGIGVGAHLGGMATGLAAAALPRRVDSGVEPADAPMTD